MWKKTDITVKHARVQGRLTRLWGNFADTDKLGDVVTEAPCCTLKQVRRPDVAFISAKLLAEHGQAATFPESFPLISEIASPTDRAEDIFAKAKEY
ncbi:MAG: Uma2 family endonuclease, partial [Cyanobacteria bacterium P01_G01_bin.38]